MDTHILPLIFILKSAPYTYVILGSAKEKAKNESENRAKWKCIALYQVKNFAEKSNDLSQFITEEAKNISHGSHVTPKIVGWFNENRRGFSSNKV